jgi:NADH:ubiquinone oxidoreductase subunit K
MENKNATEAEIKAGQIVEKIKPKNEPIIGQKGPKIRRGNLDSLSIFEVSEGELITIERGSSNSIFLNFSIFLLSIAVSFLTALLTGNFENKQTVQIIMIVITVCGFIIGAFLLFLWLRKKDDFDEVVKCIRERMKE